MLFKGLIDIFKSLSSIITFSIEPQALIEQHLKIPECELYVYGSSNVNGVKKG